jgi:hypothetical protein
VAIYNVSTLRPLVVETKNSSHWSSRSDRSPRDAVAGKNQQPTNVRPKPSFHVPELFDERGSGLRQRKMDTKFQVNFLQFNLRRGIALPCSVTQLLHLYDLSHDKAVLTVVRNANATR